MLRNQIETALGKLNEHSDTVASELNGIHSIPAGETNNFDELVKDTAEGYDTHSSQDIKPVYRHARTLSELSRDMTPMRDYIENQLLQTYMKENMAEEDVQILVQQYT